MEIQNSPTAKSFHFFTTLMMKEMRLIFFLSWQGNRLDEFWTTHSVPKWVWQPPRCKLFVLQRLQLSKTKVLINACISQGTKQKGWKTVNSWQGPQSFQWPFCYHCILNSQCYFEAGKQTGSSKDLKYSCSFPRFLTWTQYPAQKRFLSVRSTGLLLPAKKHYFIKHWQCLTNYTPEKKNLLL